MERATLAPPLPSERILKNDAPAMTRTTPPATIANNPGSNQFTGVSPACRAASPGAPSSSRMPLNPAKTKTA